MEKKTSIFKKVWNIIKTVLFVFFVSVAVFSVTTTIVSKVKGDDAPSIFNHEMRLVLTDSMGKDKSTDVSDYKIKSIPVHSMVFIEKVPEDPDKAYEWYSKIKVGDVLTFKYKYDRQIVITHRVIDIQSVENKGFIFSLMGDNKGSSNNPGIQIINTTEENSFNYIIGKVVARSLLTTKAGLCIVIIVPAFAIFVYEIIKIIRIIDKNKKDKLALETSNLEKENSEQEKEILRLKEELEKLKNGQKENDKVNKEEN